MANDVGRVSVIVPARNEEGNIARCVRSIAAQPEVREIIVVNDESDDGTDEVLRELQQQIPLLRILRVEQLPTGWLGKPHAAFVGSQAATGEWLLFTDADTEHYPGSLRHLLKRAEESGADLLSVSPGQRMLRWWEKAVMPLIFVELARLYPFDKVNDPNAPDAAANGQYILIRRSAYEAVGGHAASPQAVLEDVDLARRVKAAGKRLLFLPGGGWVETRMYASFGGMWRGWTKNLFLLYSGSTRRVLLALLRLLLAYGLPGVAGMICGGFFLLSGWAPAGFALMAVGAGTLVAEQAAYRRALRGAGFSARSALRSLVGTPFVCALLLNSLRAYRYAGAVSWKGRVYAVRER